MRKISIKDTDKIEEKTKELFTSLSEERSKRGIFTYERLPRANKAPAAESLANATQFVRAIEKILLNKKYHFS